MLIQSEYYLLSSIMITSQITLHIEYHPLKRLNSLLVTASLFRYEYAHNVFAQQKLYWQELLEL